MNRPEQSLKQHAYLMLDAIFDEKSSDDDVAMSACTLIGIVDPRRDARFERLEKLPCVGCRKLSRRLEELEDLVATLVRGEE